MEEKSTPDNQEPTLVIQAIPPNNQLPTPTTGKKLWPEKSMLTPDKAMQIELSISRNQIQATMEVQRDPGVESRQSGTFTREASPGNQKVKPTNQEPSPGNHGTNQGNLSEEPNVRSQEHSPGDHGTLKSSEQGSGSRQPPSPGNHGTKFRQPGSESRSRSFSRLLKHGTSFTEQGNESRHYH